MSNKPYQPAGARLKTFRENHIKLTQVELVKELGTSQKVYSFYESGYTFPKNDILAYLSKKYKLNTEWLISGKGEPISNKKMDLNTDSNMKTRIYLLEAHVAELQDTVTQLQSTIESALKKLEG